MIFTRRFGALAARPRFPDAPELQLEQEVDPTVGLTDHRHDDEDREKVGSSAA
jgi:hypothetical protein